MKFLLLILALMTGAAAGPFGSGGGGSANTSAFAESSAVSGTTHVGVVTDTSVDDTVAGGAIRLGGAARSAFSEKAADETISGKKTYTDSTLHSVAKATKFVGPLTGDVTGKADTTDGALRVGGYQVGGSGDSVALHSDITASGGAGPEVFHFYPGATGYTSADFAVYNLDTNKSESVPCLQYSGTTAETSYVTISLPDTLGDSVTLNTWSRGVTQATTDTIAWIFRYSCDKGSSFVTYIQDTIVAPCGALGNSKHYSKRKAVSDLGWLKNTRVFWLMIRDPDEPNDDLSGTANLLDATISVERQ